MPTATTGRWLFGFSEYFNDFPNDTTGNVDFVCFTDDPNLKSKFWNIKLIKRALLDPARATKQVKALPHRFLPEYDWSLYIDNTVRLTTSPRQIFDEFLAKAPSPYVCYRHPERNCVFEEAEIVIAWGLDNPDRVRSQMQFYQHLGYPRQNGLCQNAFILRRHCDPILPPVMERWHQQVLLFSVRDQLSLNPCMWFDQLRADSGHV